jgi:MOSC domain-containing protein
VRKLAELARYATPVGALYDAYPVHLITRASLRAMGEFSPGSRFDVRRFRPNVLIDCDGADLAEFAWCGGRLLAPDVSFDAEIPTLRCSIPTRNQSELPADPDVLRTINAHAERCLGVYADVATAGMLALGEPLELEASAAASPRAPGERPRAAALKRRALRVVEALMPRGD